MKIIVIGATGTIGVEVAKALSASKHAVVGASRNGEFKVNLEDSTYRNWSTTGGIASMLNQAIPRRQSRSRPTKEMRQLLLL
jgi:uncharacterized protein YbjT (DUF2867 family)